MKWALKYRLPLSPHSAYLALLSMKSSMSRARPSPSVPDTDAPQPDSAITSAAERLSPL